MRKAKPNKKMQPTPSQREVRAAHGSSAEDIAKLFSEVQKGRRGGGSDASAYRGDSQFHKWDLSSDRYLVWRNMEESRAAVWRWRGNWKSWTTHKKERDKFDLVRDLLRRTVLYKVGHHGSHNATLDGTDESDYPCLNWMGQGKYADEFTAMITAVNKWALGVKPKPWVHPLPSIKTALHKKASGRVFQIDSPTLDKPENVSAGEWQDFQKRVQIDAGGLFFDYEVLN
jgi:hypothetical protein